MPQRVLSLAGAGRFHYHSALFSPGEPVVLRYNTMSRFPAMVVLLLVAGMSFLGCASSPWSAPPSVPAPVRLPPTTAAAAPSSQPDPQRMQEVMAELRELGTYDPMAQDQLLENLRQSDPSLWPLVVEQFRTTIAYRQQAAERARAATTAAAASTEAAGPGGSVGIGSVPHDENPANRRGRETPDAMASHAFARAERLPDVNVERLPATSDVAVTPTEPPRGTYPHTCDSCLAGAPPADQASEKNKVVPASYTAPVAVDWRQQLAHTIEALEAEAANHPTTPGDVAQQARLRMLYAAAGRREDALRPIPATSPAGQQVLAKEIEGLSTWLNAEPASDPARQAAEAKAAFGEAVAKLAESVPLAVRNIAFCTEIQSYGCTKRFEKYEFQPGQEVLLYAEVENFVSESTPKGYHTSLRSNYRILDAHGQQVAEHAFATTEEYCQNRRRDFFIGYHLCWPKDIHPGKYSLRLSIEDLKGRKSAEASIELEIKATKGKG